MFSRKRAQGDQARHFWRKYSGEKLKVRFLSLRAKRGNPVRFLQSKNPSIKMNFLTRRAVESNHIQ